MSNHRRDMSVNLKKRQNEDRNYITSSDLFQTTSAITSVQYSTKYTGNMYHRAQNL